MTNPMDQALADMEAAQRRPIPSPQIPMVRQGSDWYAFRRKHGTIRIGKTGEDGQLSDWQELLRVEGADKLDTVINYIRSSNPKGPIYYQAVLATLAELEADPPTEDKNAAKRTQTDLLVWCICHSPRCYADAIGGEWKRVEGGGYKIIRYLGNEWSVPESIDPLSPERRASLERRAAEARKELLVQTGLSDNTKHKPALYHTVINTPRLVAWLRSQRLIP